MENPERVYDWIRDANICVPEVLLVPLVMKGRDAIGTLWIVASDTHHFNGEHARMMTGAVQSWLQRRMIVPGAVSLRSPLPKPHTLSCLIARENELKAQFIFHCPQEFG